MRKEKLNNGEDNNDGNKIKELNTVMTRNFKAGRKSITKLTYKSTHINHDKEKEEIMIMEIIQHMKNIHTELIDLSIDNTQKFIKEQIIYFTKEENNYQESKDNLRKKLEKKQLDKIINNQIVLLEDLPYEKAIKLEIEKKKKEEEEKERKENFEAHAKLQLNKKADKRKGYNSRNMSDKNLKKEEKKRKLSDSLSFMSDLSLSEINESEDDDKLSCTNTVNTILRENNKLLDEENKSNLSVINTSRSLISNDDVILEEKIIKLNEKENLYSKVKFKQPKSVLKECIKEEKDKEIQDKLQRMRKRFNLNDYLKKEKERGKY